jgi:integrase
MGRRKQRRSTEHRGVKLKSRRLPSGSVIWLARWTDPATGKEREVSLRRFNLTTREARRDWAIKKARELAKQRQALALGLDPDPPEPTPVTTALEDYLRDAERRLRPKTVQTYQLAIGRFEAWAKAEGIETTTELTPAALHSLRKHLIAAPKLRAQQGARGRGKHAATTERRSAVSINREFRSLKTVLTAWRKAELLPNLHRDDISDALAALPVPREQPVFYSASELRKLLEAAQRHDAACFAETREEHAGRRPRGSTPRYVAIAPFVAFVLLTGMRRSEALAVPWSAVDLDALDHEGRAVGEIRLTAAITKTNRARTVGLEVSPALRRTLAAMRLRAGKTPRVFHGYTPDLVDAARRRLVADYGAPEFTWQGLRSTCSTYLTNAPGIFGAATVFLSAKQLGHSVQVAERHYLGVHRGIPRDARTLEAAMQIEKALSKLVDTASARERVA